MGGTTDVCSRIAGLHFKEPQLALEGGETSDRVSRRESQETFNLSYAGNILIWVDRSLLLGPVERGWVVVGVATQHHSRSNLGVLHLWRTLLQVHWGF